MPRHELSQFAREAGFPFHIQAGVALEEGERENVDFAVLLFVLGGEGSCVTEAGETPLHRGDVLVLPQGSRYALTQKPVLNACVLRFQPDALQENKTALPPLPEYHSLFYAPGIPRVCRPEGPDWINGEYALDEMLRESREKREGWRWVLLGRLLCLTAMVCRIFSREKGMEEEAEPLKKALRWLNVHFTEEITLEQLAELAGVSSRHLDRLFTAEFQMTPKQYLIKLRMDKARTLLARTRRSVTDIAFECGYTDSNYFARVFRKECGMPPQQYRKTLPGSGKSAE